jgi:Protein of unknown function (DUF1501)
MFVKRDCEGFHRRDFLQIGSAGLLGLSLPQLLRSEARANGLSDKPKAKGVILVWLAGGPATIDMWDNKPEAPEGIRGEFKSIDTRAQGVRWSEHLPKMADVADKVSVVRSLAHTIPSHGPGTVFMTTGNKPTAALQYPSMGSLCAKLLSVEKGVPPYVSFQDLRNGSAGGSGYLGAGYNPFGVEQGGGNMRVRGITLPQGFSLEDLEKRNKLLSGFDKGLKDLDEKGNIVEGLDAFHQQALDILRSDRTKKAFNLQSEKDTVRAAYGNNPFGQGVLAARRLLEAGVRFVTVSTGGWDTHAQNFNNLKTRLLPNLDITLAALIKDLDDRGLLDSTIVMCAGEFGRTPKINKNAGRDHWARSMACVLAGGGFKRGYAHGTTDASGMAPAIDPCTPDDLAATIFKQLGIDPHLELTTPTGRPVQLFREGKVIEKLLA